MWVQGVRFVAGLEVAHLPNHLTPERVGHVKPPQLSSSTNHGTWITTMWPSGIKGRL